MQYLAIGLRCVVGAVFLISSTGKLIGRDTFGDFVASIRDMHLVPPASARSVARIVLGAELATWLLLATPTPVTGVAGFVVAAGLLAVFAVVVVLVVRRGTRAACRCFGASAVPMGPRQAVRNVILAAVAVIGVIGTLTPQKGLETAGVLIAVLGGTMLGVLVTALDDIFELFQPMNKGIGRRPSPPAVG
ncbi:MauE/DoxX family redox-associated membrane protein [Streptosporangium sp. NPDC001559]|uniref:MauE/DoxX family redox-associated membrane protein n=1 Tax=Streptosporangium sp. NPDC001559 TaxID=3366187 RepID=UPI0036F07BA8